MEIDLKRDFKIIDEGASYLLPTYKVEENVGIVRVNRQLIVDFVRGSKIGDEEVLRHNGTLHEHLLSVMIHDLQYKNTLVPSDETTMAIQKLIEARQWLLERHINRLNGGVLGTYEKL